MLVALSTFRPIDGLENVFVAERGNLRCSAIKLRDGGYCLFSPVFGLGDEATASLGQLDAVRFLLAPNHYHSAGLAQYARRFPAARLCTSERARPRLEKITGLRFEPLDEVRLALPACIACFEPQGLKTGEIWLRALGSKHAAWIVVDAFCGPKGGANRPAIAPQLLSTFPRVGIGDKRSYLDWLEAQVTADQPTMLVPCHGAIVANPRLPEQIRTLMRAAL
jgi:hypothetical protein